MRKAILISAAAITAFLVSAPSAPADRFDHVVRNKFFAGIMGDRAALDDGMKTCEEILAKEPTHAEAMVWYGTGLFQKAAEAFRAGNRQEGMEFYTKSIAVRVPRGAVMLTASRVMPVAQANTLLDRGLSDYEHVLMMQTDHFDTLGEHPRGELLFGLGEGWSLAGDVDRATTYFTRVQKELAGRPTRRARRNGSRQKLSTRARLAASDVT